MLLVLVFLAGLWAGLQNALAGGGSFVTLPALILAGLSPLAANITSTVALFPAQISSGWAGRSLVQGAGGLGFRALFLVSLAGGAVGAWLLLNTPSAVFARLVPWLVLFATTVFAWGSFFRKTTEGGPTLGPVATGVAQFLIAFHDPIFGRAGGLRRGVGPRFIDTFVDGGDAACAPRAPGAPPCALCTQPLLASAVSGAWARAACLACAR